MSEQEFELKEVSNSSHNIPHPPPPMPTEYRKRISVNFNGFVNNTYTLPDEPIISKVSEQPPPVQRDSIQLYSRTYSFYQSQWKFNNLVPEIISLILSYTSYYSPARANYSYVVKYVDRFVPLQKSVKNLRLVCRSWNEAILLDTTQQLREYYYQNKSIFEKSYSAATSTLKVKDMKRVPSMLPILQIPPAKDGSKIFSDYLPALVQNSTLIEQFYVSTMERRRVRQNMNYFFQFSEYHRWMIVATLVYLCFVSFFLLLFVQDIFISVFGSIIMETYIRYFYNIIFVPLYLIFGIFFTLILLLNVFECFQTYHNTKDSVQFLFVSLGGTSLFCVLAASTIFLIQLNIGILPLHITPSLFGRTELIPWPLVFIPWYILLTLFCLVFLGLSLYVGCTGMTKKDCRANDIYIVSVMFFLFILCLLLLLLVVWVGIAMEFPSKIDSSYIFIPAYLIEIVLFCFTLYNVIMEVKDISDIKWKAYGKLRTVFLIGLSVGLFINHILCTLSWYHLIPLAVAYLEVLFPITCFYIWSMLLLYSNRGKWINFTAYVKPARNYAEDVRDGTWIEKIKNVYAY